jgi:tetratricopeptide (TPR) repeat protein
VPFTNKQLAFKALQHGLRHASDNSKMWQNYMIVAVDVGQLAEAARALSRVISSKNDGVSLAVLSKLVDAVAREDWNGGAGMDQPMSTTMGIGLLPIVERLFEVVILPRVKESPRIYAIYAKLFRWKEDWAGALDCYMKAYRSGIASDETVERELPRFKEAVEDLEEVVDVMRLLGPRAKEQEAAQGLEKGKAKWSDWKFQARTMVRTFQGRTRETWALSSTESNAEFDS